MSLPFMSNSVTIETASDSGDKWETRSYTTSATGVPCILSRTTSSNSQTAAGSQEATDLNLYLNPGVAITRGDRVTDDDGGDVYLVEWIQVRTGLGLDRTEAGLRLVVGISG